MHVQADRVSFVRLYIRNEHERSFVISTGLRQPRKISETVQTRPFLPFCNVTQVVEYTLCLRPVKPFRKLEFLKECVQCIGVNCLSDLQSC